MPKAEKEVVTPLDGEVPVPDNVGAEAVPAPVTDDPTQVEVERNNTAPAAWAPGDIQVAAAARGEDVYYEGKKLVRDMPNDAVVEIPGRGLFTNSTGKPVEVTPESEDVQ